MQKKKGILQISVLLALAAMLSLSAFFLPRFTVTARAADDYVAQVAAGKEGFKKYSSLQDAINASTSGKFGTVTLLKDVTLNAPLRIPEHSGKGKTITLDLNGFCLDRGLSDAEPADDGSVIIVEYSSFEVKDSSAEQTGTITGGNTTGNGGGICFAYTGDNKVTFSMDGGHITGNKAVNGGGVYLCCSKTTSIAHLEGGKVTENYASEKGGGVFIEANCFVDLYGTLISDNTAGVDGGGLYAREAYVGMDHDPVILENTAGTGEGAKPNNAAVSSIVFEGSYALDGDARIGVSVTDAEAGKVFTTNLSDLEWADPDIFISDDPAFCIGINTSGEAFLADSADKHTVTFKSAGKTVGTRSVVHNGIIKEPEIPERAGGVFLGWNLGETSFDFLHTPITGDCEITAIWDAGVDTSYIDENGQEQTVGAVPLTGNETELRPGWYVVKDDLSYPDSEERNSLIRLKGDVKLILSDGKTMTVGKGLYSGIAGAYDLTVYGQAEGSGKLTVEKDIMLRNKKNDYDGHYGDLTLQGGEVTAVRMDVESLTVGGGKLIAEECSEYEHLVYARSDVVINGGIVRLSRMAFDADDGKAEDDQCTVFSEQDVIINGGDVTIDYCEKEEDDLYEPLGKRGAVFAKGNIAINGGNVIARARFYEGTNNDGYTAVMAKGDITLGYTNAGDSIFATGYKAGFGLADPEGSGQVRIAEGKIFLERDDTEKNYSGILSDAQIEAISGKTLIPPSYKATIRGGSGSGMYFDGDLVRIVAASAESGKRFKEWEGAEDLTFRSGSKTAADATFVMPAGGVSVTAAYENIPACAPVLKTQPKDLSLTYGYSAGNTLTVQAEGAEADAYELSYQWYKASSSEDTIGSAIEGATDAGYAVPSGKAVGTEDYYFCKVTAKRKDNNLCADQRSAIARVTVGKAYTSITISQDVIEKTMGDAPFTLTGVSTGNGPAPVYEVTQGTDVISLAGDTVTLLKAGSAVITVSLPESENYRAAESKTITVKVAPKEEPSQGTGTETGTEIEEKPGTDVGTDIEQKPGPNAGKDAGTDTKQKPGSDTGTGTGADPGAVKKTENPLQVSVKKTVVIRQSKLKKKDRMVKRGKYLTVSGNRGDVTYEKVKGTGKITIDRKTGKIRVKKGIKKKLYKVKIRVTAAGDESCKPGSKTVSLWILIK